MENSKGVGYAFLSSLFLSFEMLFVGFVYTLTSLDFFNVFFWSFTGTLGVLSWHFFSKIKRKKMKELFTYHSKFVFVNAFSSVVAGILLFWGIKVIGSGSSTLLGKSSFIFAVLFGLFLLKEKFSKIDFLSLVCIIFGVFLVADISNTSAVLGSLAILFSSLIYGFLKFYSKKEDFKHFDIMEFSFIRQLIMFLTFVIILGVAGKISIIESLSPKIFFFLFLGGVCGGLLNKVYEIRALKNADLSKVAFIQNFDVVIVMGLSFLILGEDFKLKEIFGAILIVVALCFFILMNKKTIHKIHHTTKHHGHR